MSLFSLMVRASANLFFASFTKRCKMPRECMTEKLFCPFALTKTLICSGFPRTTTKSELDSASVSVIITKVIKIRNTVFAISIAAIRAPLYPPNLRQNGPTVNAYQSGRLGLYTPDRPYTVVTTNEAAFTESVSALRYTRVKSRQEASNIN